MVAGDLVVRSIIFGGSELVPSVDEFLKGSMEL